MISSTRAPRGRPPLLVSADPDVVDLYVLAMRTVRIPIFSVSTAEAAVQLVRDRAVSAVIVDVSNPTVDWETCRLVREEAGADLPVVVLTGWLDPGARERAAAVGCAAFVGKPVSPQDLMEVVRRTWRGERDIFTGG